MAGAVTSRVAVESGVWVLECISCSANEGDCKVTRPDGTIAATLTAATQYTTTDFDFTLADGATDWAVGDKVYITVGDNKVTALDLSKTDGSSVAAGILINDYTAPDGTDLTAVAIVRDAILAANKISWPSGITTEQKAAGVEQLKSVGILVQEGA